MLPPDDTVIAGRYRLLRLIAQGGMGSVHEATDETTGQRVAVKILGSQFLGGHDGAKLAVRFEREIRATKVLQADNIVQILDGGRDESLGHFMVMELLRGQDLSRLVRQEGALPVGLALRIAAQACAGLAVAHNKGIVHRDIKPANLFLHTFEDGSVRVKVLDFGIAHMHSRAIDENAGEDSLTQLTRAGAMVGSPQYMSPEQSRGRRDIDGRADVWSMGVVLYRMLTRRTPHQKSKEGGLGDLLIAICVEPAPPIQNFAPSVPDDVAALVHRALQINVKDRFASAAEMHEALLALLPGGVAIQASELQGVPADPLAQAPRASQDSLPSQSGDVASPPSGGPGSEAPNPVVAVAAPEPSEPAAPAPSVASLPAAEDVAPAPPASAPVERASPGPAAVAGPPPPRPARSSALYAGLVAGAVLVLGLVFGLGKWQSSSAAQPAVSLAAPPASAPEEPARQVTVLIAPVDAVAELGGQAVALGEGGSLSIRGGLGSTHQIKLRKGEIEGVFTVAITSDGAIPPRLDLPVPPTPASASASASTRPAKPPKPARPPAKNKARYQRD